MSDHAPQLNTTDGPRAAFELQRAIERWEMVRVTLAHDVFERVAQRHAQAISHRHSVKLDLAVSDRHNPHEYLRRRITTKLIDKFMDSRANSDDNGHSLK